MANTFVKEMMECIDKCFAQVEVIEPARRLADTLSDGAFLLYNHDKISREDYHKLTAYIRDKWCEVALK